MTNQDIKKLKPKDKEFRKKIAHELYLSIYPSGFKCFYARIRINGCDTLRKIGEFSSIFGINEALKELKKRRNELTKQAIRFTTLGDIFKEFENFKASRVSLKTLKRYEIVFRHLGKLKAKPIHKITSVELVNCIEKTTHHKETPERLLMLIHQLYEFATCRQNGIINPLAGVKPSTILKTRRKQGYKTLTKPHELENLFNAIKNAQMNPLYKLALYLQALTALRTINVRSMRWEYIADDGVLCIPAEIMKTRKPFYLPLSSQTLRILEQIRAFRLDNSPYLFPARLTTTKEPYINENTLRIALRRAGIGKDTFTPHGFRSMFSTIANEHNHPSELIELCLAHTTQGVRGVYDRSHRIEAKRELMQWWGDYLEPYLLDVDV